MLNSKFARSALERLRSTNESTDSFGTARVGDLVGCASRMIPAFGVLLGVAVSARVLSARPVAAQETKPAAAHEGKSADEIARELANPNTPLASLQFKNQVRWYDGDLPNSNHQDNYTLVFQPVFPYALPDTPGGGNN